MTNQSSFMDRFGARLDRQRLSDHPDPARHQEAGLSSWRRLARLSGLDPARRARHHRSRARSSGSGWPDAGIGIVGGAVAAVDIDIADDAELAHRIEQLARERLGDTPALRIGRAPKRLLVYRTAAPFKGIKRHPLEVLCLGQQFVAYAIHPATGRPYDWPDESLAELDLGSLPAIDEAKARAFLDEAIALLPEQLRAARRLRAGEGRSRPRPAGHAGRGARGARLHPERRSRLRQLGAHRHGDQGRHRRCRRRAVRRLVGAVGQERSRRHRQDLGRLQAQQHRRRHALSPRHGARLEARSGAGARWLGAARCGASGGGVAGEGAGRSGRADAGPPAARAAAAAGARPPRWRARAHGRAYPCDRDPAAALARGRRVARGAGRADGPQGAHAHQSALQPLCARHRRERRRQGPRPQGHQGNPGAGRPLASSRRRAARLRRRADHRAGAPAGRAVPDRRVRPVPGQCGRQAPRAQASVRDLGFVHRTGDQRRRRPSSAPNTPTRRSARARTSSSPAPACTASAHRGRSGARCSAGFAGGWQPGALSGVPQRGRHPRSQSSRGRAVRSAG